MPTPRVLPWQAGTALVICDSMHADGQRVAEAPRSVLRQQVDALANKGWTAAVASGWVLPVQPELFRRLREQYGISLPPATTGLTITRCSNAR
ncbi:MAG: hypothetical protein U1F83_08945 [Verrucomicrobiota bacterium]